MTGWRNVMPRYAMAVISLVLLAACAADSGDRRATPGLTAPSDSASIEPADEAPSTEPATGTPVGPEDAVREYFEAGMTLDKARTLEVVCSADAEQFEEAEPIENQRITSYSIRASREVLGGLAQVTVNYVDASGTTDTVEVPVLEEADGWNVCFSQGYRLPGA